MDYYSVPNSAVLARFIFPPSTAVYHTTCDTRYLKIPVQSTAVIQRGKTAVVLLSAASSNHTPPRSISKWPNQTVPYRTAVLTLFTLERHPFGIDAFVYERKTSDIGAKSTHAISYLRKFTRHAPVLLTETSKCCVYLALYEMNHIPTAPAVRGSFSPKLTRDMIPGRASNPGVTHNLQDGPSNKEERGHTGIIFFLHLCDIYIYLILVVQWEPRNL